MSSIFSVVLKTLLTLNLTSAVFINFLSLGVLVFNLISFAISEDSGCEAVYLVTAFIESFTKLSCNLYAYTLEAELEA